MPHASPRGEPKDKRHSWLRHLPGRAFDNALFVVACNQVGRTGEGYSFPGVCLAFDPSNVSGIALFNDLTLRYAYLGKTE